MTGTLDNKDFTRFLFISVILFFSVIVVNAATDNDSTRFSFYNPQVISIQPDGNVKVENNRLKAGLLYDVENQKIVWQKDLESVYPIASLTKMMVAFLAVEDIHAGKVHWEDRIQWTRQIIVKHGRKRTTANEIVSYSLYDLFKNAMIASNNEAAEQIARYLGNGDLSSFIDRMNQRARDLGMNSTYYGNPTGLPAASRFLDNSSSPSDLLLLALEMLKHKEILEVTCQGYADINNGRSTINIRNHNHLTIDYKGDVDGLKTGYTKRAGFCLVATSNKCGHRLVSIALGSRAPVTRNETVKGMFNDYYASLGLERLGPTNIYDQQYAANTSTDEEESADATAEPAVITETVITKAPEPVVAAKVKSVKRPSSKTASTLAAKKFIYHTVQPGDTLYTIAQLYQGITVRILRSVNNIKSARALKPGMKIKVPTTA